ncbi:MAG TPA: type II toxin-antitoxin system prevent-host-death family antitoxin [Terriglobia bacterium]
MESVGLFEAKTHLSALVERVARGEEIAITKHGHPVARLVPMGPRGKKDPKQVAEAIRALRKGIKLEGVTVAELIKQGRRF